MASHSLATGIVESGIFGLFMYALYNFAPVFSSIASLEARGIASFIGASIAYSVAREKLLRRFLS